MNANDGAPADAEHDGAADAEHDEAADAEHDEAVDAEHEGAGDAEHEGAGGGAVYLQHGHEGSVKVKGPGGQKFKRYWGTNHDGVIHLHNFLESEDDLLIHAFMSFTYHQFNVFEKISHKPSKKVSYLHKGLKTFKEHKAEAKAEEKENPNNVNKQASSEIISVFNENEDEVKVWCYNKFEGGTIEINYLECDFTVAEMKHLKAHVSRYDSWGWFEKLRNHDEFVADGQRFNYELPMVFQNSMNMIT